MDLNEIEAVMARLDVTFAPEATAPVDTSDPDWSRKLAERFAVPLAEQLGVMEASSRCCSRLSTST